MWKVVEAILGKSTEEAVYFWHTRSFPKKARKKQKRSKVLSFLRRRLQHEDFFGFPLTKLKLRRDQRWSFRVCFSPSRVSFLFSFLCFLARRHRRRERNAAERERRSIHVFPPPQFAIAIAKKRCKLPVSPLPFRPIMSP